MATSAPAAISTKNSKTGVRSQEPGFRSLLLACFRIPHFRNSSILQSPELLQLLDSWLLI